MREDRPDAGWSAPEATVLERAAATLDADRDGVLATVVGVAGSAYRRPGAKLLVEGDGHTGSVTAGCIEGRLRTLAATVLETGTSQVERFDLTGDDEGWGAGLGCNGVVDVLLEPLDERHRPMLDGYLAGNDGLALTVVGGAGDELPVGSRWYATDGDLSTVTGLPTWLRGSVAEAVEAVLAGGTAATVTIPGPDGDVEVFCDPVLAPPALYLFGSGTDVDPVAELASRADFRVTVVSFRGGRADESLFPHADRVRVTNPTRLTEALAFDEDTYAVLMTHNLVDDRLALESLLDTPVPYIGLMGPHERFEDLRAGVGNAELDLTDADRERLYTPIGLDLGGGTPYQVATSIVAELLAVRNGRSADHLRTREASIHDRPDGTGVD
ncbi:XdhC/CoxI family protein [Haloglomus irregulare]|jgi:xanthine dehydrogenase accessory factor|uniref:XdhC/CoxI family protein n=1 Tax=Haloglomus irregulare TaxID=2234134 RepID=A0A554MV55_9EURY|nr:XdhC/CoxI family protein [Haloglomus irregulare]TSD09017.1 XdhC/CoxI family protein [Haloglomus irregulare]